MFEMHYGKNYVGIFNKIHESYDVEIDFQIKTMLNYTTVLFCINICYSSFRHPHRIQSKDVIPVQGHSLHLLIKSSRLIPTSICIKIHLLYPLPSQIKLNNVK